MMFFQIYNFWLQKKPQKLEKGYSFSSKIK
jgi:hypothetical protein